MMRFITTMCRLQGLRIMCRLHGVNLSITYHPHGVNPSITCRLHGVNISITYRLHGVNLSITYHLHGMTTSRIITRTPPWRSMEVLQTPHLSSTWPLSSGCINLVTMVILLYRPLRILSCNQYMLGVLISQIIYLVTLVNSSLSDHGYSIYTLGGFCQLTTFIQKGSSFMCLWCTEAYL